MTTHVYIDGFNLYFGCLKGTPHRWLDLQAFSERLLPHDKVTKVRYFTALISARPNDLGGPVRQQVYLRALVTRPKIEIHLGSFLVNRVRMPLAKPPANGPASVEVIKTEEKGSDVALGAHLLMDLVRGDCDTVVVISNDSDLAEPLRIARHELEATVGVFNPHKHKGSAQLRNHATFHKPVPTRYLARCQLPQALADAHGVIRKPEAW